MEPTSDNKDAKATHRAAMPGEEPACLQIAVGIWGSLLVLLPTFFFWRHHLGEFAGAMVLLAGVLLPAIGGSMGLEPGKQKRGLRVMTVGDGILTLSVLYLWISASAGELGWSFPVGVIFGTLAIFSDLALYRFRRAVRIVLAQAGNA